MAETHLIAENGQGATDNTATFDGAGGGGGHEGMGGAAIDNLAAGGQAGYDSVSAPQYLGGPGGGYYYTATGGNGGGAFHLIVDGILQVNGTLSANGADGVSEGGGGAGGSLNISAATISGTGSIAVDGGNGADGLGGGGGGGCIALAFNTNLFVGTMSAFGGFGANDGGAGTIYFKTNSASGDAQIVLDNGGLNGAASVISSLSSYIDLTIRNNSELYFGSVSSTALSLGNLLVTNASIVITNSGGTFSIIANNIDIEKGGAIVADSGGYIGGFGSEAGSHANSIPFQGGGGGNVGCGGMAASNSAAGGGGYVNLASGLPDLVPGSGGGGNFPYSIGGAGGGIINLESFGAFTVTGSISANGGNGSGAGGGGGAGGSILLVPQTIIAGNGTITANGGNGANGLGGGGGGGVVFIDFGYEALYEKTNLFTGTLSACGGFGGTNGGAGVVVITAQNSVPAVMTIDNGGNVGTNTFIEYPPSEGNVLVRNGAKAFIAGTYLNLLITSNAWVVGSRFSFVSNVTVQAGGGIIQDASGNPQNAGQGGGRSSSVGPFYSCSGASYAGYGALGLTNSVPGGIGFAGIPQIDTTVVGSGGGGYSPFSIGGAGGGCLSLTLGGILNVNGIISADGGNGSGIGGGGGSGGSIYISASSIVGTGSIMANGGNGANGIGGGGGGGSISIACTASHQTNVFAGTISAYGGGGANYGGAGLIYLQTNSQITPLLLSDNDNNVGTNTFWNAINLSPTVNVIVQGGAIDQLPALVLHPGNVVISSNSAIVGRLTQNVFSAQNLTIATGGALLVDGYGNGPQVGPGAGSVSGGISGGGGHGGYGGGNVNGGSAYDSIQSPTGVGSGGANSSISHGGASGGSLTVEVVSNLVINGRLSANGFPGGYNAGGGSGGSVYLENIPNLLGNGIISANGGAASGFAGGGGGGRIAISCQTNNFSGQISASGGPGTIFTKVGGTQSVQINNEGIAGTNTPISSAFSPPSTPFDLDIFGGASVVPVTSLPLLSNLNVSANSTLTMPVTQSGLFIGVLSNATISGDVTVDDLGYSPGSGRGAGNVVSSEGSGGGYGGIGGASATGASGGVIYGSAVAPTDFGSGGGTGVDTATGGSFGGGALRLSVLGALTINGNVSANGDSGLQDESGGGSGGSVWITAGTLSGAGTISATGGNGVFYGGGGGGGGRIAISALSNQFTGTTNASGGGGASPGQAGTICLSGAFNSLQVLSFYEYAVLRDWI